VSAQLKAGDRVTVRPAETDPFILQMQRHVTVGRAADGGYFVIVADTLPPNAEVGPIPLSRLARGWRNESGQWR
jgi:hypothetical protein